MIREYLHRIRNIIYNKQINEFGLHNIENQTNVNKVIKSNDLLLKRLANGNNLNTNNSSVYKYHYGSGGNDSSSMDKLIEDMDEINESLNKIINEEIKINTQEFINIATDAIEMIKFLGQLIEEGKNIKITEIQQQIFDIIDQLNKYLQ